MLTIALTLLAGRYHATPWGHHANEGQVEWPPSPWRLARALASVAFLHRPDGPSAATRSLLVRLASTAPVYSLPAVTTAHLRHYMPLAKLDKGTEKTTKVLDAFAAVDRSGDATILVHWPDVALTEAERADLAALCDGLGYLGRAESWVEACVVDASPDRIDARPTTDLHHPDSLAVGMLAAEEAFSEWLADLQHAGKLPKDTPKTRWAALTIDSGVLHGARWSQAPGLVQAAYRLSPSRPPIRGLGDVVPQHPPRVALYTLHNRVLPRVEDALVLGELMHLALVARSDGHPVFTGRAADGLPLQGHRHARVLALSRQSHGIDTIAVTCRDGFDGPAVKALTGLTSLPRTDGRASRDDGDRWRLTLVGLGQAETFASTHAAPSALRLTALGTGQEWVTATPYVAPRHPKVRRGVVVRDGVLEQARLAWERHLARWSEDHGVEAPEVLSVDFDGPEREGRRWAGRFKRERHHGHGRRGPGHGYAVRVRLSSPISGPVSLGYAAHFGLGVFVPVG